jgi:hypothetical protein
LGRRPFPERWMVGFLFWGVGGLLRLCVCGVVCLLRFFLGNGWSLTYTNSGLGNWRRRRRTCVDEVGCNLGRPTTNARCVRCLRGWIDHVLRGSLYVLVASWTCNHGFVLRELEERRSVAWARGVLSPPGAAVRARGRRVWVVLRDEVGARGGGCLLLFLTATAHEPMGQSIHRPR